MIPVFVNHRYPITASEPFSLSLREELPLLCSLLFSTAEQNLKKEDFEVLFLSIGPPDTIITEFVISIYLMNSPELLKNSARDRAAICSLMHWLIGTHYPSILGDGPASEVTVTLSYEGVESSESTSVTRGDTLDVIPWDPGVETVGSVARNVYDDHFNNY